MSTTPTLRDAAQALEPCPFCRGPARIGAVARDWWKLVVDHTDECILSGHFDDAIVPQDDEHKAYLADRWNRRAALTQGAGEAVEPVAHLWRNVIDGRTRVVMPDSIITADASWVVEDSLHTATQLQQAVARGISEFLERAGQYVTNDASREAAIADGVARALAPIQQAIRDYHYALDTRQNGGVAQGKAVGAIEEALDMHWKRGEELAARAPKGPPCSA